MRRTLPAVVALVAVGLLLWRPWEPGAAPDRTGMAGVAEGASWRDRLARAIGLEGDSRPRFSGYVDADYVMVTSAVGGTLMRLDVARGDHVARGAPLFALDDGAERAARDEAQARLAQAEAQLADLLKGKRQPEIDAILAQRAQAEADLAQAESDYRRQAGLRATGTSSAKQLEDATTRRDIARRRLDELDAELRMAHMPARADEIEAARAAVAAARAILVQAQWRLDQKSGVAPAAGLVFDTLYRPGELVAAGSPVVQLLPPENLKVRFFVPEPMLPRLAAGQRVAVRCDGCGQPVAATVSFVSPQAEFTPPVIYSREERARLVFMVEARPDERREALRVGQPVDVTPLPP